MLSMPKKPLLSVAIVIQNQRDIVESTLTSLYELSTIPFELYLIDDGSTDGSTNAIESLLDFYQHEHTFYFPHENCVGRGNSLNEAILQCNGPLFWAPESIQEIDEESLAIILEELANSSKAVTVQQQSLPSDHKEWEQFIHDNKWPADGDFIWNLNTISSANHFFNPYLQNYHCNELAARLGDISYSRSDNAWYESSHFEAAPEIDNPARQELLLTILRQSAKTRESRETIIENIRSLSISESQSKQWDFENELLQKAVKMKNNGRFNSALELIEQVLENHGDHGGARELKIEILEKKRRFVEASELKHEVSKEKEKQKKEHKEKTEPQPPAEEINDEDIDVSLIIPTAIHGKPALEHCLLSISEHCSTEGVELIVIDNASLDDTHDYLAELKEKNFLNCRVITNQQNKGFPASINQGLDKARGDYAMIIHNDVEFTTDAISQLKTLMNENPDYAVVGPATNKTLNPDQAERNINSSAPQIMQAEYLDSFCMIVRMASDLRMDEKYQLAFFDDIDICFQARDADYKVGIAPHIKVKHHFGTTTFPLDLDTESELYWRNVAYFNEKWDIEVFSEEELKSLSTFDQLLALDELVNPLFPEEEIQQQFQKLFTDELKTEILKSSHDAETLCRLVHLFMVMEEREVMRKLEDRLDDIELPTTLIYQLVRFYFNRNIYSRCLHYLDRLKPQNESLRSDLYRLAISVENKTFEEAIPMLKHLMDQAPANPQLYKLAGDIHKFNGNDEEANSFYDLAEQINPFEFANEEKDAFGFTI